MLTITISTRAALISAALVACTLAVAPFALSRAANGEPASVESRAPVSTAFQYQGRLELDGVPANGQHQLAFTLYSDASANAVVGSPITYQLQVVDGLFSVPLDFGVDAFTGDARWLGVEAYMGNSFVAVGSRQQLRATPYALHSLTTGPHSHFGETWTGTGETGLAVDANSPFQSAISGTNTGGVGTGVSGTGHIGVSGVGSTIGVQGLGSTSNSTGVHGTGAIGTKGTSSVNGGFGVHGESTGLSGNGLGGSASGDFGAAVEARSSGTNGFGIWTQATGSSSTGIYASGTEWAGDFNGWIRVSGSIRADDVLPTYPGACATGGCFIGDTVKAWTAVYAAAYPAVSDARKKTNITGLPYGLAEILALRPVSYAMVDDETGKTRLGLIAQEVEQVLPEVVTAPASDDASYVMSYDDLVPVLIKAIQEQQAEIDRLKAALGTE